MPVDLKHIVLFEDNHIIIVNKPSGIPVQEDKSGDLSLTEIIKGYIKDKYNKPGNVFLGVVHRLDRPVSGAVIFARTSKALMRLNEMMKKREITKIYWAITKNQPPQESGSMTGYIKRNESRNKSYVLNEATDGAVMAELNYRMIGSADNYHLIEIELITGRHHQIRTQLAAAGCPVKGDLKYGFPRSNKDGSICLLAREIRFIHPVNGEMVCVQANPHDDPLWKFFLMGK